MSKEQLKKITQTEKLTVNTKTLQSLLDCGKKTATRIGDEACAKVMVGKYIFWDVEKIKKYIEYISE